MSKLKFRSNDISVLLYTMKYKQRHLIWKNTNFKLGDRNIAKRIYTIQI